MTTRAVAVGVAAGFCLQGCFFIYVPGSVIGSVSDSITGAEGENCVGAKAKVGDRVALPGNGRGTIKSLSGTSTRCQDPNLPIRALLVPDEPEPRKVPGKCYANGVWQDTCP